MGPDVLGSYAPRLVHAWARELDHRGPHTRVDGSLAFVDISGFTALAERLAGHGREGAEELTRLIEQVFRSLLTVAYERDGSLLKFGGDALLLWFHGPEHARRAVASVGGMQRELRTLVPLASLAGPVHLRMSAAVRSGPCDLFLVGDSHHELVVTGPAATELVQLEGAATAGEVLVSASAAAALPPAALGAVRAGGRLLRGLPVTPVVRERFPPARTPTAVLERLLPTTLRRHLLEGGGRPEHRRALVGFVTFTGTDVLLASEGPAACAAALQALVGTAQQVADEHDLTLLGSDVAAGGGKLIVVAGAPWAHEDDADRVLFALRRIVDTDAGLAIRAGVNAGPLFAGSVGPPYRRTYTVMGDTVNLAARLSAHADPGAVLATRAVTRTVRQRFTTTAVPAFAVKGKTQPVDAVLVGATSGPQVQHAHRLPLVGRSTELGLLEAELARARESQGRVVEIVGPSGIGKSRLLSELRARHTQVRTYYATGDPYGVSVPYAAIRGLVRFLLQLEPSDGAEQLRHRIAAVDPELAPWTALVGSVTDIDVTPGQAVLELGARFRAARLRQVVGRLLVELLPDHTVVRLEDVHWFDDASWAVVEHLLRHEVPRTRWLVTITGRDHRALALADRTLTLGPLDARASEELAHRAAEQGLVSLDAARELASRADGHPLFLEELLAFSGRADELPDTVERTVAARLDALPPRPRELLRLAALLGQRFEVPLLRSVTGLSVTTADLEQLGAFVRRVDDEHYSFEHDLFREVAYESLPYRRRRELHDRVARVIETRHLGRTDEVAEVLALHYHRAGRHLEAWRYCRTAAQRARDRYALDASARYLRWALDAERGTDAVDRSEVARTWRELGDDLELLGAYAKAGDAYARARELAGPDERPALWLRTGIVRERQGNYPRALWWYARTRNVLADRTDHEAAVLRARAWLRYAEVRLLQGRPDRARAQLRDLLPTIEALADTEVTARARFVQGWALGHGQDADDHRRQALAAYEQLDDLVGQGHVHVDLGIAAYYRGAWRDATEHYERARQLKERIGDTVGAAVAASNIGEVRSDQGRLEEAEERFDRSLVVFRAAGFAIGEAVATGNLGRVAARRGDLTAADEQLREAHDRFRTMQATSFEREMWARRAELALFQGDLDAAVTHASRVRDDADDDVTPAVALAGRVAGLALALGGDLDQAIAHLERARADADAAGSVYDAALTDVALGQVRGTPDARTRRAEAMLRRLGVVVTSQQLLLGVSPR